MVTGRPLIPDRTLRQIAAIADRSKRSSARIGRRTRTRNTRGGSTMGPPVFDKPIPCRLDPSGLSGGEFEQGSRLASVGNASVAIKMDAIPPDNEDQVEVTTVLPNGVKLVELFEVVGSPFATSYAVEIAFPVQKIGN